MSEFSYREAFADTENEILADALGVQPETLPLGVSEEIEGGDDFADVEGWNGEPLSAEEQIATHAYGHPDSGQDRPLQHEEEVAYLAQLRQAEQRIAELEAHTAELAQRADPELQQRLAAQKEEMIVQMLANPEQAAQQIYQEGRMAGLRAMNEGRVNVAMGAAHRKYGRDFEEAYHRLTSLQQGNQVARATVNGIMESEDPGEAVMDWYEAVGSRGTRLPPFLGGSGGEGARHMFRSLNNVPGSGGGGNSRGPVRPGDDYQASTDWNEESSIMDYALGKGW